jgi:superfamily II DNA or RNA helicase
MNQQDQINQIFEILYNHQKESLTELMKEKRGKFILPTGTGKTFIQAANIAVNIIQNPISKKSSYSCSHIHIVQVPRILLSYQILNEVYFFLNKFKIPAKYLVVHSGTAVDEGKLLDLHNFDSSDWLDIEVTTKKSVIQKNIIHANNLCRPLIIVQTYHSADNTFEVLRDMGIVPKTVQNDECQYLVSEEFSHLLRVETEKFYSYTATQKDAHHIGMNNEELWGKELYKMTPREAIDRGIIVRPRMIYQASKNPISKEDERKSFSMFVESDWGALNSINNKVKNKMLVKTRGTDDMDIFINSKECNNFIENGVHVFAIGSNDKINNWYNGEVLKRTKWLEKLQSVGDDENSEMIVLHFDILSEGIDVPGFTGISLFSAPELDKFIQNFGRTARLDKTDRQSLKDGNITTKDLKPWKKPYSYVIVHEFNDLDKSQSESISQMVSNLREYGFDPKRDVIVTSQRGVVDGEPMEDLLGEDDKRRIHGKLVDKYELYFRTEDEKDARLSAKKSNKTFEQLNDYFLNMFG